MPGSKTKSGLGRSLIRSRFIASGRSAHINPDGSIRLTHLQHAFWDNYEQHTTEMDDSTSNWVNMQSITQESDLEAFLSTAQLAGTEFTAERLNVSIVSSDTTKNNPFLLSPDQEAEELEKHRQHRSRLTVPRRPKWDASTTADQLQTMERDSFLTWRRDLVVLEETHGLILTPYERNIEVWRQLWRVIERSDLVIQIVDARNPLFYRSADLEKYVKEISEQKKNLLLVNKADLLTRNQRKMWSEYLGREGIRHIFFSAALAKERMDAEIERERRASEAAEVEAEYDSIAEKVTDGESEESAHGEEDEESVQEEDQESVHEEEQDDQEEESVHEDDPARILGADELLELIQRECPGSTRPDNTSGKVTIGFVGYPNVGKSSTLNALVGAKRVAVGSTPGKTKHFQTIHLSDAVVLCDCPGLVFPSFATTKAEMVCCGVLPIDQLREHVGPTGLVCQRIPKAYLEAMYGISIKTRGVDGKLVEREPTAEELLSAYAIARGFVKSSQGNPDESRAARYILKDYVNGRLLFVHPPPDSVDGHVFNREMYEDEALLRKQMKKVGLSELKSKAAKSLVEKEMSRQERQLQQAVAGQRGVEARQIDVEFFRKDASGWAGRSTVPFAGRTGGSAAGSLPPKKSHKKGRREKKRTQWTKEDA